MSRLLPRLCLVLLLASAWASSGCFGQLNQNPSYFPNLWPTQDATPTHAKPGLGYYTNFDPNAVTLEVRPLDSTNPVRTQHVLIATVKDKNGTPRRDRRIEWMIEGVGNIIEVDESGLFHRGYKTGRQHAVSSTAYFERRVNRGNDNANDDFMIRPGQTWCIISSAVEGDTHVTVYAPGVANWEKSKVYTTLRWVDAAYVFPGPIQARAGTQASLTTKVFRHTDKQPLAKYDVRYKILDGGPPAVLIPNQTREAVVLSDLSGNAQIGLAQIAPALGVNRIGIEVIRPPDPSTPGGSGVVIGRGEATVEWLAPALSLNLTGPAAVNLGSEVAYEATVTNTGKVEVKFMELRMAVPDGLNLLQAQGAFVEGRNLVFTLPTLPPGMAQKVQASFKTLQQGQITTCATVTAPDDGLRDQKCVTTSVTTASLKVALTGPPTVVLGSTANFQITINNPGSGPLNDLLLTASFTDGLEHQTKARTLRLPLGSINGQETKNVPLELSARQVGNQTVQILATSSGNLSDQAQATVLVQRPQVKLNIDGPPRKYVGRQADWTLELTNSSDTPLANVVVRDRLPAELGFVSADQGGRLDNNDVLWVVGQLQPREKRILRMTTTGKAPAKSAMQNATVTADPGIRADAQAALEILSTPAGFKLEMSDKDDPVQVGKTVTYVIKVTNTGLQPANQVEIKAVVPPELKIVNVTGPSEKQIAGQMVTFAKIDNLEKDRPLEYTIECQALRPGDVRFRVELRAQGLEPLEPVSELESTKIFDTQ